MKRKEQKKKKKKLVLSDQYKNHFHLEGLIFQASMRQFFKGLDK